MPPHGRSCWPCCSAPVGVEQKDAFLNRTYHRLTSRDNGWFNANEKLKEVVRGMEDARVDDYDEVLPLFIYGTGGSRPAMPRRPGEVHRQVLARDRAAQHGHRRQG